MAETFFTSDHHFGHARIIEHCKRPFADVDEMTEAMVERWNSVVGPHDDVYHLGDFAYRMRPEAVERVFRRLRGRKHLIIGNHDDKAVLRLPWSSEPRDRRAVRVPGEALPVVLDHYAMRTWPKSHYGAVHLYGHSHGALPGVGRSLDVGVDVWDFRPVTLGEIRPTLERQQSLLDDARAAREVSEVDDENPELTAMRERAERGDPASALEILERLPSLPQEPGARVIEDPGIMSGEPCVAGTRVPARTILAYLKAGRSDVEIFEDYPTLPVDGIDAVRAWAAALGFGLPEVGGVSGRT